MATVITQTYSANTAITFDISGLLASSTFLVGRNSIQVDNSTTQYVDAIVTVDGITDESATAPTVGQMLQLYAYGSDTSFVTKPIGGAGAIDGVDGGCTLPHVSVLNSLRLAAVPTVTVATASLVYYIQPFSVAQLFGGILPKFWGLYLAHNLTGALATAQSGLFRFNGITYTST